MNNLNSANDYEIAEPQTSFKGLKGEVTISNRRSQSVFDHHNDSAFKNSEKKDGQIGTMIGSIAS